MPNYVPADSDEVDRGQIMPPSTGIPSDFTMIEVRKFDGTTVEVQKSIQLDADSSTSLTSVSNESTTIPCQTSIEELIQVGPAKVEQIHCSNQQSGVPKDMPAETPPSMVMRQIETTAEDSQLKPQPTGSRKARGSSKVTSRQMTPAKIHKINRTMDKLHRNFSRTISATDSTGDAGSADSDISDTGSIVDEESDT